MENKVEREDRAAIRNLILAVVLGVILSGFTLGNLLMTVPILMVCPKIKRTSVKMSAFAAVLLGAAVWTVIQNRSLLGTEYWPVLFVGVYMPAVQVTGSAAWTAGSAYSRAAMRRLFWASIPVFVIGAALSVYFSVPASENVRNAFAETILYLFPSDSLSVDVSSVVHSAVNSMMRFFAPGGVLMLCIPIVISDISLYKYDEDWQYDFANMKLPEQFVWLFFASWAIALVCHLVSAVPAWITALSWNLALTLTVLYLTAGVSIAYAFVRKRTAVITAGRVVFLIVFLCLIPGINMIVLPALPLLGVLETWVRLR